MKNISRRMMGLMTLVALALAGCATHNNTIIKAPLPNVDHQLAPGEWGLRKVPEGQYPNMQSAFRHKKGLITAIDRSIKFMQTPSSQKFFPDGPITHSQELASLFDFKYMLRNIRSASKFQQLIDSRYDVYIAKGYDNRGSVWFTGYYTPILYGSLTKTTEYRYPVYKRPHNLVSNPVTGQILGQRMPDGSYRPFPTRRQILQQHLLSGHALVWFANPLDAYVAEIQGSAKVILTTGQTITIGYAGDNGRTYTGLGETLVKQGKISARKLSLPAIQTYFQMHPNTVEKDIMHNHFMAFLKIYNPAHWPLGSLGVKVTAHRSLATDKTITAPPYQSIFPRAALTFVETNVPNTAGTVRPFRGFMLDQDTGGAIRAAGRADIYMGIGPEAQTQAGYELSKGKLYYLFLKPGLTPMGGMPLEDQGASGSSNTTSGNSSIPSTTSPTNPGAFNEMFPGAK